MADLNRKQTVEELNELLKEAIKERKIEDDKKFAQEVRNNQNKRNDYIEKMLMGAQKFNNESAFKRELEKNGWKGTEKFSSRFINEDYTTASIEINSDGTFTLTKDNTVVPPEKRQMSELSNVIEQLKVMKDKKAQPNVPVEKPNSLYSNLKEPVKYKGVSDVDFKKLSLREKFAELKSLLNTKS